MKQGTKGKFFKAIGAATLIFMATGHAASAGADDTANDTILYWSGDVAIKGSNTYGLAFDSGFSTALNGNIDISGWIVSGNLGYAHSKDVGSKSDSFYTSGLVGYQWQMPDFYISLSTGILYSNNDEKPGGGKTDGDKVGAAVIYGFGTNATDALYVQSYGSYATINDQFFVQGKLGYKTTSIAYGAEYTLYDDNGSKPTHRIGAFVGDIALSDKLTMTVSAGYQTTKEVGTKDGAYANIGFSVPVSFLK